MDNDTEKTKSDEEDVYITPDIIDGSKPSSHNLLPKKSRLKYLSTYDKFTEWRSVNRLKSLSESVLLAYFTELSRQWKPSSLWATYSMLRSTIKSNDNVNIATYQQLGNFLKSQSVGYVSKKSEILSEEDVSEFLKEAPDNQYLAVKVALIFGFTGGLKRDELCKLTLENIEDKGSVMIVKIPADEENTKPKTFIIMDEYTPYVQKYAALRPKDVPTSRFFLNYKDGKCTANVIGRNKFGSMPKVIARFLNLPNADCFTGHSFRRSSATMMMHTGMHTMSRKRRYLEDRPVNREKVVKVECEVDYEQIERDEGEAEDDQDDDDDQMVEADELMTDGDEQITDNNAEDPISLTKKRKTCQEVTININSNCSKGSCDSDAKPSTSNSPESIDKKVHENPEQSTDPSKSIDVQLGNENNSDVMNIIKNLSSTRNITLNISNCHNVSITFRTKEE